MSTDRLLSVLEKPLAELTGKDLGQLTREDCRHFLKSKGMRRPSWNKAQVMQQAISLKALLEGRPGAGDPPVPTILMPRHAKRNHPPPPAAATTSHHQQKEVIDKLQPILLLQKEPSPNYNHNRRDPMTKASSSGNNFGQVSTAFGPVYFLPARSTEERRQAGQLRIFCDGEVGTHGAVPPSEEQHCYDSGFLQPALVSSPPPFNSAVHSGIIVQPNLSDRSTNRKASLQRYLEKKKDRFKGKRIHGGASSSSIMDGVYSKYPPLSTPSTRISSVENKFCLSFDLNDDGCGNT